MAWVRTEDAVKSMSPGEGRSQDGRGGGVRADDEVP
jgi:hypothetical protein